MIRPRRWLVGGGSSFLQCVGHAHGNALPAHLLVGHGRVVGEAAQGGVYLQLPAGSQRHSGRAVVGQPNLGGVRAGGHYELVLQPVRGTRVD
jgi:hypothetical protein